MFFNLSSSQADRINFDEAIERYADDCIQSMPEDYLAETPAEEIAEAYWNDGEGYETDDAEEAKARFVKVFTAAISEAKAETDNLDGNDLKAMSVHREVSRSGLSAEKHWREYHAGFGFDDQHEDELKAEFLADYNRGAELAAKGYRYYQSRKRTTVPVMADNSYSLPVPDGAVFWKMVEAGHIATATAYRMEAIVK